MSSNYNNITGLLSEGFFRSRLGAAYFRWRLIIGGLRYPGCTFNLWLFLVSINFFYDNERD